MSFLNDPGAMMVPAAESPFLDNLLDASDYSDAEREQIRSYARDGFLIFDPEIEDFDAKVDRIISDLAPMYPDGNRRVADAWMFHEDVRAIAGAPKVLDTLRMLYQRRPIPFQTLNFDVGTQQCTHSDSLHFYSFPYRFMCGVWVALESTDEDNGPLHYYPGSHRLREYDMFDINLPSNYDHYESYEAFIADLAKAHGFERKEAHLKKGQAIIWAANLLHGGQAVKDKRRTRQSQVTHYFFEDCVYYLPMNTEPFAGKIEFRECIDVATGEYITPMYKGKPITPREGVDTMWRYPRPLPSFVKVPKGVPK